MSGNVPEEFSHLEKLTNAELELEVAKLRQLDETRLTEAEVSRACAIFAILRRKTAGPPKKKVAIGPKAETLGDVGNLLGLKLPSLIPAGDR